MFYAEYYTDVLRRMKSGYVVELTSSSADAIRDPP